MIKAVANILQNTYTNFWQCLAAIVTSFVVGYVSCTHSWFFSFIYLFVQAVLKSSTTSFSFPDIKAVMIECWNYKCIFKLFCVCVKESIFLWVTSLSAAKVKSVFICLRNWFKKTQWSSLIITGVADWAYFWRYNVKLVNIMMYSGL